MMDLTYNLDIIDVREIDDLLVKHIDAYRNGLRFLLNDRDLYQTLCMFSNCDWEGHDASEASEARESFLLKYAEKYLKEPLSKLPSLVESVIASDSFTVDAKNNKVDAETVALIKHAKEEFANIALLEDIKPTMRLKKCG